MQDKEVNALLDTGAEKSCMFMDMFARLKLPLYVAKVPKLRNASGRDKKTHGVMTRKFKMGNTNFIQEFVVCVRPIIIGRDFMVNNFIGIAWTRQGTKKVTKDDKLVIEIEELTRKKTLTRMRKVEEISGQEEYRNWVPKKKGFLPIPLKSNFLCSPAEVSAHRKVKLKSKPISEDTAQRFEELCECFPEE